LLRHVDALVDLLVVLAAGALVGHLAALVDALVDLLVVLVGEVLGLVHEVAHVESPLGAFLPSLAGWAQTRRARLPAGCRIPARRVRNGTVEEGRHARRATGRPPSRRGPT